jgi:hypothetical protein
VGQKKRDYRGSEEKVKLIAPGARHCIGGKPRR